MVWRKFPEGRFFALLSGVEALGIRVLPPKHDFQVFKSCPHVPGEKIVRGVKKPKNVFKIRKFRKFPIF